ncbi:MAG: hypothetical protein AAB676_05890 [Verrucomicrobiota bacterium]
MQKRRCQLLSLFPASCLFGVGFAFFAAAHTLPISYLTVVPDEEYVHLELVLNPFELSFFSEIDRNKNARLDPAEIENREANLCGRILDCLKLRVNGTLVPAEIAGFTPDLDSHHATLRAHYRVDARRLPLAIESKLAALTSGSHLTQVTCRRGERIQIARLDTQSATATFEPVAQAASALAPSSEARTKVRPFKKLFLLFAPAGMGMAIGLVWFTRKHARQNRVAPRQS